MVLGVLLTPLVLLAQQDLLARLALFRHLVPVARLAQDWRLYLQPIRQKCFPMAGHS